jgi:hypothetical protein
MNEPEILWIKNHLMKIKYNDNFYDISPFEFSAAYLQYCINNNKFILNNNRLSISNFISFFIEESNTYTETRRINSNYKSYLKKSIIKPNISNISNKLVMTSNVIGKYYIDIDYIKKYADIIYSLLNNKYEIFFKMYEIHEINDIFDYRYFNNEKPSKLKSGVIIEKFDINNNKYILLGYPDQIKMKNFYYKNEDDDKYFFESNNFQQILNDQKNQKEYLINFLNFFYYNNDINNLNNNNLWKFSTFGINFNNDTKYISENTDFIKNNSDFFNIIKKFLNKKMEESFNKINTTIKYNFILYHINSNNYLEHIVQHFTQLNNNHTEILEKVYNIINDKMNNFINNNFQMDNNSYNNYVKNNFLIYIKQGGSFIIYLEYNNPFKNIYSYNYFSQKNIFFQDLIDYTKMYSYQDKPVLSIYNPKTFIYINENDSNDDFINSYKNNINNQKGGYNVLHDKNTKVILFNIKMNKEVIAILENNNKFYFLNIISNLNYYKKENFDFLNNLKDLIDQQINNKSLLYKNNKSKLYFVKNNNICPYKFICFELTNENKFFNHKTKLFEKSIELQKNFKESFILNDFLKSLPIFLFQISNDEYKKFYNNLKFSYNILNNSKNLIIDNYLQNYSNKLLDISNNDSNIEINFNNEYFFKVNYIKNKCIGFLFRKENIIKNGNKKNDKNINNLICFDENNISIFQNGLNLINNIIALQLYKKGNKLYNEYFANINFKDIYFDIKNKKNYGNFKFKTFQIEVKKYNLGINFNFNIYIKRFVTINFDILINNKNIEYIKSEIIYKLIIKYLAILNIELFDENIYINLNNNLNDLNNFNKKIDENECAKYIKNNFFILTNKFSYYNYLSFHFHINFIYDIYKFGFEIDNIEKKTVEYDFIRMVDINYDSFPFIAKDYFKNKNLYYNCEYLLPEIMYDLYMNGTFSNYNQNGGKKLDLIIKPKNFFVKKLYEKYNLNKFIKNTLTFNKLYIDNLKNEKNNYEKNYIIYKNNFEKLNKYNSFIEEYNVNDIFFKNKNDKFIGYLSFITIQILLKSYNKKLLILTDKSNKFIDYLNNFNLKADFSISNNIKIYDIIYFTYKVCPLNFEEYIINYQITNFYKNIENIINCSNENTIVYLKFMLYFNKNIEKLIMFITNLFSDINIISNDYELVFECKKINKKFKYELIDKDNLDLDCKIIFDLKSFKLLDSNIKVDKNNLLIKKIKLIYENIMDNYKFITNNYFDVILGEFNFKDYDNFVVEKYKEYLKNAIIIAKENNIKIPSKYIKLIDNFNKYKINEIFSFNNIIKQKIIIDMNNIYKNKELNNSFNIFYDNLKIVKDLQNFYREENYNKWESVREILGIMSKNISQFINNFYPLDFKVSNAFTKIWEILFTFNFNFKKSKQNIINSFHFAELPGQMINCLNYYLKMKESKELNWYGESLNPKHPDNQKYKGNKEIFGDQYGFLKKNPDRWIFGPKNNNSGDITNTKLLKFYREFNKNRKLNIITSDAGLDSTNIPLEILQKLDFAQALAVISSANKGTDVIVKHFTPYINQKPESKDGTNNFVSLIAFYAKYFEDIYLFKPMTSNQFGGEFYLIGLNCKGMDDIDFEKYCDKLNKFKVNMKIEDKIPNILYNQIYKFFDDLLLKHNYKNYENSSYLFVFYDEFIKEYPNINKIINLKYKQWIKEYQFQ